MPRIKCKSKRQNKLKKKKHSNDQIYCDMRLIKDINFGQDITISLIFSMPITLLFSV